MVEHTAKRLGKGSWEYRGVHVWRSEFTPVKDSKGEWYDCYPPSLVRWEMTKDNSSYGGCEKTLRAAKQFIDQQKKEGNK